VVANNQSTGFPGWTSLQGNNKNRFWLIDNLQSPLFDGVRICYYQYHRQGMDLMFNPAQQKLAKQNIKSSLMGLKAVNKKRPSSFLMQLFFDAKSQEIINIFNGQVYRTLIATEYNIHHPQIRTIEKRNGSCIYLNSGDWIENLTALEYHKKQWNLFYYLPENFEKEVDEEAEILNPDFNSIMNKIISNESGFTQHTGT
jgi:UDP-2,3-diacylglucosamine pyrophosphatase LpxH